MPITTYYDPKIKNYVSGWSPKKSEKNEDETLSTMFNLTKDNPGKVLSAGAGGLKRYVQGDEDTRNLVNDAARLAAESQVSNQRLAGASQGQDSYMSQHYAYQPAKGYDDWYSTIFGA